MRALALCVAFLAASPAPAADQLARPPVSWPMGRTSSPQPTARSLKRSPPGPCARDLGALRVLTIADTAGENPKIDCVARAQRRARGRAERAPADRDEPARSLSSAGHGDGAIFRPGYELADMRERGRAANKAKAFGPAAMAGFGAIRGQIAQSNEARRQRAAATGQHSFQSRLNLGIWVAAVGLIGLVVFASRRGLLSQSGGSAESGSSDSYSSSYSSTDSSSSSSSSDSGSSSDGSGGGGSAW